MMPQKSRKTNSASNLKHFLHPRESQEFLGTKYRVAGKFIVALDAVQRHYAIWGDRNLWREKNRLLRAQSVKT